MGKMRKQTPLADALAENVRQLMEHHGLSQLTLAKKSGVGQATLSGLLSEEPGAPRRNPRAETIDKLAAFLGIPSWALCMPGVPLDMLLGGEVQSIVGNLIAATPAGRDTIRRLAEAEGRYALITSADTAARRQ